MHKNVCTHIFLPDLLSDIVGTIASSLSEKAFYTKIPGGTKEMKKKNKIIYFETGGVHWRKRDNKCDK